MHRIGRNFITSVHLNIIKRTAVSRAIVNSLREKIDPSDFQLMYPKQNQPALSAFRSRIGLSSIDMNQIILCIDHSAPDFDVRHSNGNEFLAKFLVKSLTLKYPKMNPFFINRIKEVLMGQESLNRLAQDFGLIHVVKKDQRTSMNLMILALVDLIKTQKGVEAAELFCDRFFLSKQIDFNQIFSIQDARPFVNEILEKEYKLSEDTRLLNESGRKSPLPVFVVGIFAGLNKLGEGFGQSIEMAQHAARLDFLKTYYLSK